MILIFWIKGIPILLKFLNNTY
uniref:Uncharacterized protein n=1 Tax=Anguilla anguilla TaxID=7936 RepID=A0A0E9VC37_ANGAN